MTGLAEHGRSATYQWLLRAPGAYLDEQPSCRLTVVEVGDAFMVRVQRALHKMEPEVYRLEHGRLRDRLTRMLEERAPVTQTVAQARA